MINLLHIDCMEYMAGLEDNAFDLAIVDPPYGGNDALDVRNGNKHNGNRNNYKQFENIPPEEKYFSELKRVSRNQIIWGVNFYKTTMLTGGRIVWNKKAGHKSIFGTCEIAYFSNSMSCAYIEINWNGYWQDNMSNKEIRIHPTQKPVKLYEWLLTNYAKPGQRILDTHLGSGSSAIAAHYYGCDFVGCELDEDYYNAACDRFDMATRQVALL